jgi:flagellar biosynthesis/type III secretory pathway protein FliH
MRLLDFILRKLDERRWHRTLVRLYPTQAAYNIQVERRLDASARTVADAYHAGYADGAEQGYVTGYTEGANETLRIAKRSVRRRRGREVEVKAWVQ